MFERRTFVDNRPIVPRGTSWRNRGHWNVHDGCKSATVAGTSVPRVEHEVVRSRLPVRPTSSAAHPSRYPVVVLVFAPNRAEPFGLM